jgi:glutamate synthase (NADPH/NADH) small chain
VIPAKENGRVQFKPVPGSGFELPVDLVLLAMGFVGAEPGGMLAELGVKMTERGTVWRDRNWMTSVPGVFTAGDMQRGQSLIVWAIAEGRSCARGVDLYLMGQSELPAPLP